MQTHSHTRHAPSQENRRPRVARERDAETIFDDLLDARRRSNLNAVRRHLGELATLGYGVEDLDAVGFRLVDNRPGVLPFPSADRSPVLWFARLVRSLAESDPDLESRSLAELERLGFGVDVARENRKGVSR